jgi:Nucleotidyl transferase AbiEii toxin, Type IV TA system
VIEDRKTTIEKIDSHLQQISGQIDSNPVFQCIHRINKQFKTISGLIVKRGDVQIKIEPNLVIRGSVYPVERKRLSTKTVDLLERDIKINVLPVEDLYAGKMCAALDRQHPRDLFDIKILFENEGITESIRKAFIVYLLSHNRPINELLAPNLLDISNIFHSEFRGMSLIQISLEDLVTVREQLISTIQNGLTKAEKTFLLSFKKGNPDWAVFDLPEIKNLPAIQWKLHNIRQMENKKWSESVAKLEELLK